MQRELGVGLDVTGIQFDGASQQRHRLDAGLVGDVRRPRTVHELPRLQCLRRLVRVAHAFGRQQPRLQAARDAGGNVVLHFDEVGERVRDVERLGPHLFAARRIDEIHQDSDAFTTLLDVTLYDIAHTEFGGDRPGVARLARVAPRRAKGDDEKAGQP